MGRRGRVGGVEATVSLRQRGDEVALLSVVIEEMVTQAHDANQSRWDSLFVLAGFVLFAAVSTYVPS